MDHRHNGPKRVLATGDRVGSRVVLMEIEKQNSSGRYDVIVFCYDCRKAKRMMKATWADIRINGYQCQCHGHKRWQSCYRGQYKKGFSQLESRMIRSLSRIR